MATQCQICRSAIGIGFSMTWTGHSLKWLFKAHLCNWCWRDRTTRRLIRELATGEDVSKYLDRYVPVLSSFREEAVWPEDSPNQERIFSIWFQGEAQAPDIVKACWRSAREHCSEELVVLDKDTIFDYVQLPDYVVDKWRNGRMSPAHFSDICRLYLLYKYGGYWLDATVYLTKDFPDWLRAEDFFLVITKDSKAKGSFAEIQNCFIRAKRANFLVKAWLDAALSYWKEERRAADYFIHQLLFIKLLDCNGNAKALWDKMPKLTQGPTHTLWYSYKDAPYDAQLFDKLTRDVLFHKLEYRSESARNPKPGSIAEKIVRSL